MSILFFDLDGTLMVNPFWKVVFPRVTQSLADLTGFTPDEMFAQIMGEHDRRLENPGPDRVLMMDWEDIIQTVAQGLGVHFVGSAEELVVEHAAPPHTAALDQADSVLAALKQQHHLVVATMGLSKYQFPVLKALGLYDLFDDFLTPDLTACLKTDREFYAAYADVSALKIHIGDRYDHDCYFPKQFGAKAILRLPLEELAPYAPLERPQHLAAVYEQVSGRMADLPLLPDAIITHLDELPALIPLLEG